VVTQLTSLVFVACIALVAGSLSARSALPIPLEGFHRSEQNDNSFSTRLNENALKNKLFSPLTIQTVSGEHLYIH
jgi:hypothetical protein